MGMQSYLTVMSKFSDFNVYAKEDIMPRFSCLEYQRRKRWWAQQSFHPACANGCQAILIATITSPVAGNLASFQMQAEGRPSELQRLHKIT